MNNQIKVFLTSILVGSSPAFAQSFDVVADASLKYKTPSTNYGNASLLEVDKSDLKSALLKFSVTGISGSISSAKIRLYVSDSSSSGPEIYQTSAAWSESTVNWSNQPAVTSALLDDKGSVKSGTYIEYNVLSVLKGNGEYSFLLKADSSDGTDLASREGKVAAKLIIVASGVVAPDPAPVPAPTPAPLPTAYIDDTYSILNSGNLITVISQNFGYNPFSYSAPADGKTQILDMRLSSIIVANSKNPNPTLSYDCTMGSDAINTYPIITRYADATHLVGALVKGIIPQESDWRPTYCNSAAISIRDGAINNTVDGARISAAWDAIREAEGSNNLTIKNSWISNVRDDVVENDFRQNLNFVDNLADGVFQGISIRPSSANVDTVPDSSANLINISGSIIKFKVISIDNAPHFGALFKTSSLGAPKSHVYNSVVAVDPGAAGTSSSNSNWINGWIDMSDCRNNVFLWMSDRAIPSNIGTIPACFKVIKGQAAIDMYNKAKKNWIDCHPRVRRDSIDPVSDPSKCVANDYGGFSNE